MPLFSSRSLACALLLGAPIATAQADPARDEFIAATAREHGLAPERIGTLLGQARYRPEIVEAISRPAEAKPWHAYRTLFLDPPRISAGRAFVRTHAALLARLESETGVPGTLLAAIIGVETRYGQVTGRYRVLDALYTLGFHYPPRQAFFRRELGQLFALAEEEALEISSLKGSYAGAMGWGQFMPSSYRAYARDGDGDGRRDLFGSAPDVLASIANYFVVHGWQPGEPVAIPAIVAEAAQAPEPVSLEPKHSLAELGERGFRPAYAVGHDAQAAVLKLDGADAPEYWIAFRNFYVITRYNRSPLYAMAVYQLAGAIAEEDQAAVEAPAS